MTSRSGSFTRYYGAHPLHLLTMVAGFALLGYVLVALTPDALWNPGNWWQSIAVWFAVAVIGHDLVLFPLAVHELGKLLEVGLLQLAGDPRRHRAAGRH